MTPQEKKKEIIYQYKDECYWVRTERPGGQQCGVYIEPVIIKNESLSIEIKINYHRERSKNREVAKLLMDLAIEELIKL